MPFNSIKQRQAEWASVAMCMRGHPKSDLHDAAGAMTSAERQTPLTQRREDLVLFTGRHTQSKMGWSVEKSKCRLHAADSECREGV